MTTTSRTRTTALCTGALVAALALLTACSGDPAPDETTNDGTTPAPQAAAVPLVQLAGGSLADVGFAIDPARLSEPDYKRVADAEFSLVVPENVMKWETTEPQPGQFDFGPGDQVVDYAQSTGKKVYGHNLVWHSQLPDWVEGLDAPALQQAMDAHVTAQATHYRGKVIAWDVVNEAFEDDGTRRKDSPFQQKLGDGYVEEAFRTARAADPDAALCYNDYGLEQIGPKSDAVLAMVQDFKARGVPIDCVGFQGHLVVGQVPADLEANLQRFAALGVDVRITELDVRVTTPPSDADLQRQADDYATVVTDCLAVARCQGVTFWGLTDKYSWVPQWFSGYGAALVWDEDYQPKPAYDAVAKAFGKGRPADG